jgi:prepilin signal peptidase PulO-like enzyme (type II secretory pathway)
MTLLFTVLGLLVGGLVNRLATDLPAHQGVSRPHCPYCGQERPWWQWVSLPSYLVGRAKCAHCDAPIRFRYQLVEIGLAVTYGFLWIRFGPSVTLLLYLVYSVVFALILITDFERRLILNAVTYPAILFAVAASFITPDMRWWSALAGGAIGFTFFFLAALVGNWAFGSGALGAGDVKLALFIGLITGFPLIIETIVLAIIIGAGISLLLLVSGVRSLRDHVPYGPFLVAGAVATLLWGYPIADRFLPWIASILHT